MADIIYIPPNFGIKKFQTEAELKNFLKSLCFEILIRRPSRDVWETNREPKRRAIAYKSRSGLYIAAQLNGRRLRPARAHRVKQRGRMVKQWGLGSGEVLS
jgi:hypothetical protein